MLKLVDENAEPFLRVSRHEEAAPDLQSSVWGARRAETAWDVDLVAATVELHAVKTGRGAATSTPWRPPAEQGLLAKQVARLANSPGARMCMW